MFRSHTNRGKHSYRVKNGIKNDLAHAWMTESYFHEKNTVFINFLLLGIPLHLYNKYLYLLLDI